MLDCLFNTGLVSSSTMLCSIGFILMCAIPHGKLPLTSHLNNIQYTGSHHLEQRIAITLGVNACGYTCNGDGCL
jgi:hypothetical protein